MLHLCERLPLRLCNTETLIEILMHQLIPLGISENIIIQTAVLQKTQRHRKIKHPLVIDQFIAVSHDNRIGKNHIHIRNLSARLWTFKKYFSEHPAEASGHLKCLLRL